MNLMKDFSSVFFYVLSFIALNTIVIFKKGPSPSFPMSKEKRSPMEMKLPFLI